MAEVKQKQAKRVENTEGVVHIWHGYASTVPQSFDKFSGVPVHKVAVGTHHYAFVTRGHQVYTYGNNQYGQLGDGTQKDCFKEPQLVEALREVITMEVACGSRHTMIVTLDGLVYSWGDSRQGQCGIGDLTIYNWPQLVKFDPRALANQKGPLKEDDEEQTHICQISCGEQHTLAVTDSGELWTWGSGIQLGLSNPTQTGIPRKVEFLSGRVVLSVACGEGHSLALVQKLASRKIGRTPSKDGSPNLNAFKRKNSRSQSPIVNNIQTHRNGPSTCTKCQKEIYTYTETSDTCIISTVHKCPLGVELSASEENISVDVNEASETPGEKPKETADQSPQLSENVSSKDDEAKTEDVKKCVMAAESKSDSSSGNLEESQDQEEQHVPDIKTVDTSEAAGGASAEESKSEEAVTNVDDVQIQIPHDVKPQSDSALLQVPHHDALGSGKHCSPESTPRTMSPDASSTSSIDSAYIARERLKSDSCIPKSHTNSSFLDEMEAKDFLHKQLYGDDEFKSLPLDLAHSRSPSSPPCSPFVKKMGDILNYVPSAPTSMQEYVTTWTSKVVSNIKTSIDKFSFVSSQNTVELDNLSLSKSSSQDSISQAVSGSPLTGQRASGSGKSSKKREDETIYGTMTKSTSMGFPHTKPKTDGERKSSLPTGTLEGATVAEQIGWTDQEVVLDTEVWSWGQGAQGQLGQGDLLDRPQPGCITVLSEKNVIKIASGDNHCMALTADSQSVAGTPMWDIAAGSSLSLVVADGVGYSPDVFFAGKYQVSEKVKAPQPTLQLVRLTSIRKAGWVKQVAAGGDVCACLTDKNTAGHIATLHEFTATERTFYRNLHHLVNKIIKPLLNSDVYKAIEASNLYGRSVKLMVEAFVHLVEMVGINMVELTRVIQGHLDLERTMLIGRHEEFVAVFQHYSKSFGDVLALGGFDYCAKCASAFLDKMVGDLSELLEEKQDKVKVGVVFRRLMQLPMKRLKDYSRLTAKLALKYAAYSTEHFQVTKVSENWNALKQAASIEHNQAEATRAFWDACPPKLSESLKVPGRRLLRESRAHPLSVATAKRFSMHWLLLFNDVFVHGQYSIHQIFPLATVWVEAVQDKDALKNAITLTLPEESLTLTAPTTSDKADWYWAINQAIDKVVTDAKNLIRQSTGSGRLTPPLTRHATHIFYKHPQFKDAKFMGMWVSGKMHGHGELQWPDGRRYVGKFKQGQQHGQGVYTIPKADGQEEVQSGQWKDGKMDGLGSIKYANGDIYEGYFKEGKRHGHGVFKQGKLTASLASIYIGEWKDDKKNGYGVMDDILKGDKFMGMWQDDFRHGNGIIVTIDGMYFEGNFVQNKMTGFGLMMTEDNSSYEGDFTGGPSLSGKGTLTMPNGDYIDGQFSGSWAEGIKVNGIFYKNMEPVSEQKGFTHALGLLPKSFGQLSVPADRKWEDIFRHCRAILGCQDGEKIDSAKAWEVVAVMVSAGKKSIKDSNKRLSGSVRPSYESLEILEKIPPYNKGHLSLQDYRSIKQYLAKAFDTPFHPLGKLMEGLVDVYRATNVGVGAHCRLLPHAVAEVKSYVARIYPVIRILFPDLPATEHPIEVYAEPDRDHMQDSVTSESTDGLDDEDIESEVVTRAGLLHSLLLPKIYPPLFTLYALYNEKEDDRYWKRVLQWNKQGDIALMSYLGMDEMFWLIDKTMYPESQKISSVKDKCYREPIETLQHISTSFCPAEKLELIQRTFNEINKTVRASLGNNYLWNMDDLFPVFQYVVVRSRIRHLGAEIHFIDDLMEDHLELGELGIMFTTLKACYFQIQNEKVAV